MKVNLFVRGHMGGIGGMEVHAAEFMRFGMKRGWSIRQISRSSASVADVPDADVFFFNDLGWMDYLPELRHEYSHSRFVLRSGGNDLWHFPNVASVLNETIDLLVVNSDFSYRRSVELGVDSRRLVKIRGGVPDDRIERLRDEAEEARARFDEAYGTRGRTILAIVGRLERFKGVVELLKVLSASWCSKWFLVVAGDGRIGDEVRDCLGRYFRSEDCIYLGELSHEDALWVISTVDVLISASREVTRSLPGGDFVHTETMGRSLMEGMALGVKVIATAVGGVPELKDEFPHAIDLVGSVHDIPALLHNVKVARKDMSSGVCERYGWMNLVRQYEDLFDGAQNYAYSLDYDGTLIGPRDDPNEIARIVRSLKGDAVLMLNTARPYDESLLAFAESAGMECAIFDNGAQIVDLKGRGRWKAWSDWVEQALSDDVLPEIMAVVWKTDGFVVGHVNYNSLVIRKDGGDVDVLKRKLIEVIGRRPYRLCESQRIIKVIHGVVGKAGAAQFVCKDMPGRRLVGVGDGLEDRDLQDRCGIGFCPQPGEERGKFLERVFHHEL